MKVVPCPKCRSIRTGVAPAGAGWMHCEKCNHTWMHGSEAELAQPDAAGGGSVPAPAAEASPAPPPAAPAATPSGSDLPDLPAPAMEPAATASPTSPSPSPAPAAPSPMPAEDEVGEPTPGADYLPETDARRREELQALTNRHDAPKMLETEEFTPTSSPTLDPQGGAPLERSGANRVLPPPVPEPTPRQERTEPPAREPSTPRSGPRSIPAPERPAASGPAKREGSTALDDIASSEGHEPEPPRRVGAAPGGSQVAFDLFDAIEKEIEHEREQLQTVAQEGGQAHSLSCPVCSHRFKALADQDSVVCPKCGSDVTHTARYERERTEGRGKDPLIGIEIRGCRIDRKIGEGGMGSVYHARQLSLDRSVAIKVLPPELKRDKKFLTRFEQEAKSLARINHPNIMHVYDFGEDDAAGIYFMVMEFVDGLDLAEILRQKRKLPQLEVMDMVRQSALGLSQASEKGVVHRDIKPDNLMVTADGVWKVSDFGLAKHVDALTQVTRAGIRVGTPAFMSPEQCDGKPLDFRSDIYSLGVTAYVSLSGRLPFDGESPFAIMLKHKTQHPVELTKHVPDIDPDVAAMVMRMLSKDPVDRAPGWQELIEEIEDIVARISGAPLRTRSSGGFQVRSSSQIAAAEPVDAARLAARDDDGGLPPIPRDLMGERSRRSPAEVVEREGSVTTSRRVQPGPAPIEAQVAQPAGRVLPDAGTVGQVFDAIGGEDVASTPPPPVVPVEAGLELAPLPDAPPPGTRPAPAADAPAQRAPESRSGAGRGVHGTARRGPTTSRKKHQEGSESRRNKHAQQASERHRQRLKEVGELEQAGDAALGAGRAKVAAKRFQQALQLCQELDRKSTLVFKLEQARRALRRRRRKQVLLAIPVLLLVLAAAWWQGMPRVHREFAAKQYAAVDTASEVELEAYIERHERWRRAYTAVFPSYDLPSLERANEALALLHQRVRDAQKRVVVRTDVDRLQDLVADESVPWSRVLERARELLPKAEPTDQAVLATIRDQAKAEVDRHQAAQAAIERHLAAGEIPSALQAAQELASEPRLAPEILAALPRPLVLAVTDRHGRPLPAAKVLVDGVVVPDGSGAIFRRGDRPVRLEVTMPGYIRHVATIDPGGAGAATEMTVELLRGRAWEAAVRLHGDQDWIRLVADEGGMLWAHGAAGTSVLRASDGTRMGTVQPPPSSGPAAAAWMPWFELGRPGVATVGSAQGAVYRLESKDGGIGARELLRLDAPIQTHLAFDASFRDGVKLQAAVVSTAKGSALVGVEGDKPDWRIDGLKVGDDPLLLHRQARLLVVGMLAVYAVEEDGRPTGTLTFPDARVGSACVVGGEHLLVPSHDAIHALRTSDEGQTLQLIPQPLPLVSPPVVGLVGDERHAALVTGDGRVLLVGIVEGIPQALWEARLAARFGRATGLALSADGITVVGDGAQVAVLDPGDGAIVQVVDHDGPVLGATVVGQRLVVYGGDGRLVAYEFIPQ